MAYVPNELRGRLAGRRLNAVVFSMDYVILWFDGDSGSRNNVTLHCDVYPKVERSGIALSEPDPGYGDGLRAFVPETVTRTVGRTGMGLAIEFPSGRLLLHPSEDELGGIAPM